MEYKIDSERIFSDLCGTFDYTLEKIPTSKIKTPDYRVNCNGRIVIAEIKEFTINTEHENIAEEMKSTGTHVGDLEMEHDLYLPNKMRIAADQLKQHHKDGCITLLVLYSSRYLGPTDYKVEIYLQRKMIPIPPEISAVLLIPYENISPLPDIQIFKNQNAQIQFPCDIFKRKPYRI